MPSSVPRAPLCCLLVILFGSSPLPAQQKLPQGDAHITYPSMMDLVKELKYNVVRRDQLIAKNDTSQKRPVVTVKTLAFSVSKRDDWNGVVIMTLEKAKDGSGVVWGRVFVDMVDYKDVSKIRNESPVTIVGFVSDYESSTITSIPSDVVTFYGVVMTEVKQLPSGKKTGGVSK